MHGPADQPETEDLAMTDQPMTPWRYTVQSRQYAGTLLTCEAPRAGILLAPDWQGQSALARAHARHWQARGCSVAIADLYGDGYSPTSPDQVGPMVQHLLAHRAEGAEALAAGVEALRSAMPAGTPVVVLGYSAGGLSALDLARSGTAAADGTITCSALLKTAAPGAPTRAAAPVLVIQGTCDVISPPAAVVDLVAEMDAAGNDLRVLLLGRTHHGFDNPEVGTDPTQRLVYSAASAARAREAVAAFVDDIVAARSA